MLANLRPAKRIFGRDITNLDQKRFKNSSICEKTSSTVHLDNRHRARSFEKRINVQHRDPIVQYQSQILSYMMSLQCKHKKEMMTLINEDMRQILIDWLVDVHLSFELKEQTLYLALAYLNTYASTTDITKHDYQLVGIACLWIASKYEEIYPPRMQNYIQVTDSSYSEHQLKDMEGKILLALNFELQVITPLAILQAVTSKWSTDSHGKLPRQSMRTIAMSKYLIELSLFQGLGQHYCMKTLVLSSLMLSDSVLKVKSQSSLLEDGRMDKDTLMRCFKQMCVALQNSSKSCAKLKAIKKKYNEEKYLGVAKFRIQQK